MGGLRRQYAFIKIIPNGDPSRCSSLKLRRRTTSEAIGEPYAAVAIKQEDFLVSIRIWLNGSAS